MRKIYLDWNIINHIEETPELFEFIKKHQAHFVFVYSPAHFADLMRGVKPGETNIYLNKDIEKLETICETHLLKFSENKLNVYKCCPREFLEKEGKDYPLIEHFAPLDYFKDSLRFDGMDLYSMFSDKLKATSLGETIEHPLFGSFSNVSEFFECLMNFMDKFLQDAKVSKEIKNKIKETDKYDELTSINNINPKDVINLVNTNMAKYGIEGNVVDIVKKYASENLKGDDMSVFKSVYLSLDFLNYHSDKRNLWNIMTDAEHAFYGSFCDVLVTNDSKMKLKTEALYSYFNKQTKVIAKEEFLDYLQKEIAKEFDFKDHIEELLTNQNIPDNQPENSVYFKWKYVDSHLWGFFDKIEFRKHLNDGTSYFYLYRDIIYSKCFFDSEIGMFFNIIRSIIKDETVLDSFEKDYVDKFKQENDSASFAFYVNANTIIELQIDKECGCPLPCMFIMFVK